MPRETPAVWRCCSNPNPQARRRQPSRPQPQRSPVLLPARRAFPGTPELRFVVLPGILLAPQTLQSTVTGEHRQIRLAWPGIPGAAGLELWRLKGEGAPYRRLEGVSTESVYVDRDVRYGTLYSYRIGPAGIGPLSTPASGHTSAFPTLKLEAAAALSTAPVQGITLGWSYAWVAAGGEGIRIYDVHDPANPQEVADVSEPRRLVRAASYDFLDARAVATAGERLFVADRLRGLMVLDLRIPEQPVLLGSLDLEQASDVAVENPATPRLLGSYDTTDARGIADRGRHAYLADSEGGLWILDLGDPRRPVQFETESVQDAGPIAVLDNHALLAHAGGLLVVRVLLTGNSFEVGCVAVGGKAFALSLSGGLTFVTGHEAGVTAAELSDLSALDAGQPQLGGVACPARIIGIPIEPRVHGHYFLVDFWEREKHPLDQAVLNRQADVSERSPASGASSKIAAKLAILDDCSKMVAVAELSEGMPMTVRRGYGARASRSPVRGCRPWSRSEISESQRPSISTPG